MTEEPNVNIGKSFDAAQDELKALQLKSEEYLNGWKRERADFLNYKKDEMERIGQLVKYANEEIILKIIPILDNLCLAASHPSTGSGQALLKGVEQIKKQLEDFLQKEGIEPIETIGKPFDPNFHEVVEEISPSEALAKEGKPNTVVAEVQRGYTMHGRIIRVAKVKISK
ncbi:MAG: nucleotide exchange factor GrpE [Candidatus Staskawiczbacteria bacterium]|nr:nucleotide exchange factor GrpE [Candidatus Staskawiczbacteria bacterium]